MNISVYNLKGGVGKTCIALNLALTMDALLVTNDPFIPLKKILPEKQFIKLKPSMGLPDLPDDKPVVFDLNGYFNPLILESVKQSKWILIPVTSDFLDIQVTINCINEIKAFNEKIVIIANRTEAQQFRETAKSIFKFFKYPVFNIKKSKALPKVLLKRKSIKDMCASPRFPHKRQFSIVADQFKQLITYLEKGRLLKTI